jgi:hypothetical protein
VSQALQVAGAILILSAFVLAQLQRLDQQSYVYLWLNAVGSGILAGLAYADRQWGFLLLEGVWSLVSLWGIVSRARAAPDA